MKTAMLAAKLHAWDDVRIEPLEIPRIGAGEALVRIEACGVCGSDALTWYVARKAPAVLGHEPVGIVEEIGRGVSHLKVGDRVFVHHHAPCLQCENCRRCLWSNCATWRAAGLDPGGFAQYVRVSADSVARDTLVLPDTMSFDVGTFIEPLACCIRAVRRQGGLQPSDSVLIVGLGAMGLLMVQLARVYGAKRVLGTDFVAERRALATGFGASAVFDPAAPDSSEQIAAHTDGRGADVVIVCPGDSRAITAGLRAAAPGGRVVCFTPLAPEQSMKLDFSELYFREISILQSYSCGPDETREALRLLADGSIDTMPLITHRDGLRGVADALRRAKTTDGIKTIIYPWR